MTGQGQLIELRAEGLACARGGRILFEGLHLSLRPSEAALVTGPNGIGKSSLLRLLAGLLEPFAGTMNVNGRIALANEDLALDPRVPLYQALSFWAKLDGQSAVKEALDIFGIGSLAEVPVRILSTGQRKRALLARTVASGADIWLLDEPGNGLDSASLQRLNDAMAQHRARGGIIIAASHQPLSLPGAQTLALGG
jgi:heme exporter protein A